MENKKNMLKNWKLWVEIFIAIIVIIIIKIGMIKFTRTDKVSEEVSINNIEASEYENKEFTDEEIIEFAKEEIKKKLRYPETAIFELKQLHKEQGKYLIDIFCISLDKYNEEARAEFMVAVEQSNNKLKYINIGTNSDTCNTDVAKEFEELVNQKKYNEIYDNLFSTKLKSSLSKDDFISYNLDLFNSTTEAKPIVDSNNYIKYINVTIKDKNNQYWIMILKNGMIYNFSKV